jgi:hypothetical protein
LEEGVVKDEVVEPVEELEFEAIEVEETLLLLEF